MPVYFTGPGPKVFSASAPVSLKTDSLEKWPSLWLFGIFLHLFFHATAEISLRAQGTPFDHQYTHKGLAPLNPLFSRSRSQHVHVPMDELVAYVG